MARGEAEALDSQWPTSKQYSKAGRSGHIVATEPCATEITAGDVLQVKDTQVMRPNKVKVEVRLREVAQLVQQGEQQPRRVREVDIHYFLQHCPSGWKIHSSEAVSAPVDKA